MTTENQDEETLDRDFSFFLSLTKTYYQNIVNDKCKELCKKWLEKLCGKKIKGISQKRSRNILLSQLIIDMKEGNLSEHFLNSPTCDKLPSTSTIFGIYEPEIYSSEENNNVGFEDFQERSADGRTYVAIRYLPNSQGTYAFVALNIDKKEEEKDEIIIPCSIDKSEFRHLKTMKKLQEASSTLSKNASESQMEDFYIRNIDAKVFGNEFKLEKKLHSHCGRNEEEIDFIDLLLKQIDEEIKGKTSGDNRLVKFLSSRLMEDLKRIPKMKHIFEMKPDQQRFKILQILRQKLIVRLQEGKHKNIIDDVEERILASTIQPECCKGEVDEPEESMWKLMITKPLNDIDMRKLQDVYPDEIISTFLDLLVEDRRLILERGKKRQNKMIESMRSEIYKEINSGKAEFNKAREVYREWNEILSIVEETMFDIGIEKEEQLEEQEKLKSLPHKNEELLKEMIANIKETENLMREEACHGEELTKQIKAANSWTCSIEENKDDEVLEMKEMIDNVKEQIVLYKIMIKKQEKRIMELRNRLDYD